MRAVPEAYLWFESEGPQLLRQRVGHAAGLEGGLGHLGEAPRSKPSQEDLVPQEVCLLVAHLQ